MLEFQLTSNVRLNNLSDLDRHPLKDYLRAGVRCVQGTDGGALYGTNSIDEELALEKLLGLSHDELRQMRSAERAVVEAGMRRHAGSKKRFPRCAETATPRRFTAHASPPPQRPAAQFWRTDGTPAHRL